MTKENKDNMEITKMESMELEKLNADLNADLNKDMADLAYIPLPKISVIKDSAQFDFGNQDFRTSFTGYIIGKVTSRAHWDPRNGDEGAPDCTSLDMVRGTFYPELCENCQKNKFNKAGIAVADNDGCKTSMDVFVMIDGGGDLPYKLHCSATSIKHWAPFVVNARKLGAPVLACHVEFTLKYKEESKTRKWSELQLKITDTLTASKDGKVCFTDAKAAKRYAELKGIAASFETAMYRSVEDNKNERPNNEEKPY